MDKLISEQAAIDIVEFECGEWSGLAKTIVKAIEQLPPTQPERETGTWIIDSGYPQHCWCSKCNHLFSLFDPKSIHFCPNCGREMKTCVWKSQYEKEN